MQHWKNWYGQAIYAKKKKLVAEVLYTFTERLNDDL